MSEKKIHLKKKRKMAKRPASRPEAYYDLVFMLLPT